MESSSRYKVTLGTESTVIPDGVCSWAIDPDLAERLWMLSERLTGVEFKM